MKTVGRIPKGITQSKKSPTQYSEAQSTSEVRTNTGSSKRLTPFLYHKINASPNEAICPLGEAAPCFASPCIVGPGVGQFSFARIPERETSTARRNSRHAFTNPTFTDPRRSRRHRILCPFHHSGNGCGPFPERDCRFERKGSDERPLA